MSDAGEIKARVSIEYDGSGVQQAKEDLASLADIAGGIGGEGGIGDAVAAMGDRFAEGAGAAEDLTKALDNSGEALGENASALDEATKAAEEHQQAIEDVQKAHEDLQPAVVASNEAIAATPDVLDEASRSLDMSAKNMVAFQEVMSSPTAFDVMNQHLSDTGQSYADFAKSIGTAKESALGNVVAFQDIISSSKPVAALQDYLAATKQSVEDFSTALPSEYAQQVNGMLVAPGETAAFTQQYGGNTEELSGFTPETLWSVGEAAKSASGNISGFAVSSENANKAVQGFLGSDSAQYFTDVGASATDANKAVAEFLGTTEDAGQTAAKTGGIFSDIFGEGSVLGSVGEGVGGFFGGIGDTIGGFMMGLNNIAMPLMAVQMLGQMASSFGSYIYNANLTAEGAGASNPASFTSQVDQLGKTAQQGSNQFAVGFGAGLNPSINAWNNSPNASGGDFWSGAGKFLGGSLGVLGDLAQMKGGILVAGIGTPFNPDAQQIGQNWTDAGYHGLVNTWDAANGLPLQYPGTPSYGGSGPFQQMAVSDWSSQPGGMTPKQQNVVADWQYFNNIPNIPASQLPAPNYGDGYSGSPYTISGPNAYTQPGGWSNLTDPSAWSGMFHDIGQGIGNAWNNNPVANLGTNAANATTGFFGGLGQDWNNFWGKMFAPLTSGPSPDMGNTSGVGAGAGVGSPGGMTSYLRNTSGGGGGDQSVEHTFVAKVNWVEQGLTHEATAVARWAEQGVEHAVTAVANWAEQGVQHAVTAVANWAEQNVIHPVVAAAEWTEQNLQHAATAVAQWTEQNVQHAATAIANWTEQNVVHPVTAAAEWAEQNLEHTFTGKADWEGQNLTHTFTASAQWVEGASPSVAPTPSYSGYGYPAYASGTSYHPGGGAIVGEAGSEVIEYNGQYSQVNEATFVNLPIGAAVYPVQELSSYASPRMLASGTGGGITPITLPIAGGSGGGAPVHIHNHFSIDGRELVSIIGPDIASTIRAAMGYRGY